jgi:preprotein translocase subunit SecG
MGILTTVSVVFFVILCVLIVIIVLLQSDKSAGMGVLGGSSQSAFGSSTADVITKITAVMVAIYMLGSLGLSALQSNRSSSLEKKVFQSDKSDKNKDKSIIEQQKEQQKPEEKPVNEKAADRKVK